MTFADFIKWLVAGLAGAVGYLFGGWNAWFITLLIFIGLDYITGMMASAIEALRAKGTPQEGKVGLSSKVGLAGLFKKFKYLGVVIVAHLVDGAVGLNGTLRTVVIGYLIANEGLSILENAARVGVPFPAKLMDVLKQLRDKE
jgi:toxin secretion/phage lysis holin